MKDTVTLKELLAIVVRRGRFVLTLALVFAVLIGGVQTFRQVSASRQEKNSPEKIEERYQEALVDYQIEKENLEKELSNAQRKLESQQEYNEESLLMRLDPYNKYVTTINLAVTDVEEEAFRQVFQVETTPIEYLISKIQSQYLVYWDSLDLESALVNFTYAGTKDKYLREMVSLSIMDGGGLTLEAYGESEQDAKLLAQSAYTCLQEGQATISAASYKHTFTLISQVTKNQVDEELVDTQKKNLENVKTCEENIEQLTQQLNDLKEPTREEGYAISTMVKSIVKWTVLGITLGIVLGIVVAMVEYLFRNRVETSREMEQFLSVPLMGIVSHRKGLCNIWADKILGERIWNDEAQAGAYLEKSVQAYLPNDGVVALLSTLPLEKDDPEVQKVINVLAGHGMTVQFVGDAGCCGAAMTVVQGCTHVILAERCGTSNWVNVETLTELTKRMEKPIVGFVLI